MIEKQAHSSESPAVEPSAVRVRGPREMEELDGNSMPNPLPDFLVLGAPRCGTTTLCDALSRLPDVFLADPKEPEFFTKQENWLKGSEWYSSLFRDAVPGQIKGEGSAHYACATVYPDVVGRIKSVIPSCRMILAVRHPIRRIESHWKLLRGENAVDVSLDESVRLRLDAPLQSNLTAASFYYEQWKRYTQEFPSDQIKVVFLEDWKRERDKVLEDILQHVGSSGAPDGLGEVHSHASSEWKQDRRLMSLLRRAPGFGFARSLVPSILKEPMKRIVTTDNLSAQEKNATLSASVKNRLLEQLADDARRFLEVCGKPSEFWDLT